MVEPISAEYERMAQQAKRLVECAISGEIELLTTHAVIAEVVYVTSKQAKFSATVNEIAARLSAFVRFEGLKINDRSVVLEALEIWRTSPSLGFVDALAAAYGRQPGIMLATFDKGLEKVFGVTAWEFDNVSG
jgi:predicted nucleic acid-binding protein